MSIHTRAEIANRFVKLVSSDKTRNGADQLYRVVGLKLITDDSPHVVIMTDSVESNMVVIDLYQPVCGCVVGDELL